MDSPRSIIHPVAKGADGVVTRDPATKTVTKTYFRIEALCHEAKVMQKIVGLPCVVQFCGIDKVCKSIRMEDGGVALVDHINDNAPDGWYDLFEQIVTAVGAIHDLDVVHGDIKPDNILLCASGRIRLCDFGHSRVLAPSERGRPVLTRPRGTLPYACPEMLEEAPYDGFAADVWSIGIVLFALVSARCPFREATADCGRYRQYHTLVIACGHSPTNALLMQNESEVFRAIMQSDLFSQNMDGLLHPLPGHRVRIARDL